MVMGKKRKQTKQVLGTLTSKRQRKRRKTQGKGFKRSAKIGKESGSPKADNIKQELIFPCRPNEVKFCGMRAMFPRVLSFSRIFQSSNKLGRLSSIRNVFLLLDWLKQIFGCGLQTLGEFLSEKDHSRKADGKSEFQQIIQRMENLEKEVKLLKAERHKKRDWEDNLNSCTSLTNGQESLKRGSVSHPSTNAPAPPPPPPPPPPVLAPPPPPLAFLKKNQKGKELSAKKSKNTCMPPRTLVTLEDLKKVKLRKVNRTNDKENVQADFKTETTNCGSGKSPAKEVLKILGQRKDFPQCVVSLKEIKRVTLKRTRSGNEMDAIKLRSPEEMVVMRRNLRKVNIVRSPGGTPLISERNNDSGTGLTPMMTNALRRKFQQAHPYSPDSPKGVTRRRQSFSPLADLSRNTPSPFPINKKLWS